jgi:hypothetical protein
MEISKLIGQYNHILTANRVKRGLSPFLSNYNLGDFLNGED